MNRTTNFNKEKEKESFINSIDSLEKTNHEMRLLIENLHEYKANLEGELKQNKQDFNELEKELQELKNGLAFETQKNQVLVEDDRRKEVEIQILMEKIDNIETNFAIQAQEIKLSYESAMQYLNAEIELHKKSLIVARNTIEDCHKSYIDLKDNKKLLPLNENLENQVKSLEFQLNENNKILKETNLELEKYRREHEMIFNENQELKYRMLSNEKQDRELEQMQAEISQLRALKSEKELMKKADDENDEKYRVLLNKYERTSTYLQEKEEGLKKAYGKHEENQEKLNEILRSNAQLAQINQENIKKNEEMKIQNDRLKEKVSELLSANEKLNKKMEELAFEHQACFDNQRLEKEHLLAEFEQKHRKFLQEQEYNRKELENKLKSLELQFSNERDAFLREKKSMKMSFELEFQQLTDFTNNLKGVLYEHETQINHLKEENEALMNEKQRIISEFEAQMMNVDENNQNYRVALSNLENTCQVMNRENQDVNMNLARENDGLRRFNNVENYAMNRENQDVNINFDRENDGRRFNNVENYSRFNSSKAIVRNPGMMEFEKNRMGRTGNSFERKTLDLLKNNDRLNEQILRRCREIVGE